MTADEFDDKFDHGEDITAELDLASAQRPDGTERRTGDDPE